MHALAAVTAARALGSIFEGVVGRFLALWRKDARAGGKYFEKFLFSTYRLVNCLFM